MTEIKTDLTGDHAENLNVITRNQERKNLLDSLPKKTHDLWAHSVRKFDGRGAEEAEAWLKDIDEWLRVNELCLVAVFDLLLTGEAATLWRHFRIESTGQTDARQWFLETFTLKKTIYDLITDLASVSQSPNERFAAFEIRVRELVDKVLDSKLSRDEIVNDIVAKKAKSAKLREALITRPEIKSVEIRSLAKLYEDREQIELGSQINSINTRSYAEAVRGFRQGNGQSHQTRGGYATQREMPSKEGRPTHIGFKGKSSTPIVAQENTRMHDYMTPRFSMKQMARRLYNKCKGRPMTRDVPLQPNQCFCCGNNDHVRAHCPMRDKCLICGKHGHRFRDCHLLEDTRSRRPVQPITCVQEDDYQVLEDTTPRRTIQPINSLHDEDANHYMTDGHSVNSEGKNELGPVAYISSVGSSQ